MKKVLTNDIEYVIIIVPKERKVNKMKKVKYYLCLEKTDKGIETTVKTTKSSNGMSIKLSYKDAAGILHMIALQLKEKEAIDNASD